MTELPAASLITINATYLGNDETPPTYPGIGARLSDGTWIGFRLSDDFGPTIDISFGDDNSSARVHVEHIH